jgi:hypothetical protein
MMTRSPLQLSTYLLNSPQKRYLCGDSTMWRRKAPYHHLICTDGNNRVEVVYSSNIFEYSLVIVGYVCPSVPNHIVDSDNYFHNDTSSDSKLNIICKVCHVRY